ncbi:MAG: hypothetical protein GY733_23230 [bacterium]|nr:hypothetical protein [bacterium]
MAISRNATGESAPLRGAIAVCMLAVCCAFGATGCMSGAIYSHTTVPLDTDFDNTPVHDGGHGSSWKRIVIPLFYVQGEVEVNWGDISIADAMDQAKIETVHYADIETLSVLRYWTQTWVHVYGE